MMERNSDDHEGGKTKSALSTAREYAFAKSKRIHDAFAAKEHTMTKVEPVKAFKRGDRVRKKSGSSWHGIVCGEYSTSLTPEGYCVESERETGSVQLYPAAALEPITPEGE